MKTSRRTSALLLGGIVALSLTSCAGTAAPTGAAPISGGTLTIGESADTAEVDPQISYYDSSWRLQDMVYDSLVTTDEDANILPSIAESWTEDGTVYTFTLRERVTFSNGRALTVDDVVGSLERLLDPATGSYWTAQIGPVTEVSAVDDRTVRVELASPWSQFLASLANVSAAILPMRELNEGSFDPATDMLGSGPFRLESHTQDQEWVFRANEHYWGASEVALDEVVVRIVPDDAARVAAIRDGSLDIAYFANPDAPALLAGVANAEAVVQDSSDMYWLLLNAVDPDSPFVDPALRRAVATAIDREGLIETALAGVGTPTAVTPAGLPGACDVASLPTYEASAEDARELLESSGLAGQDFGIISPPYLSSFDSITQYLQQNWSEAGLGATIETPEMGDYIDRIYTQSPADFDAAVDYFSGYLFPTMVAGGLVINENEPGPLSGFVSPTPALDEALAAVRAADDPEAMQRLCAVVAEEANVIPLATKSTTIAVRTDQVDADIPAFDGYDIYLRNVADYVKLG